MKGYYIVARKSLKSKIWHMPPHYWKIWNYFLAKANWDDYGNLKRGQLYTSIKEIQEDNHWYVGFRKETFSKSQVSDVLDWLRDPEKCAYEAHDESNNGSNDESNMKAPMIETVKATHGMLITIVKYGIYQDTEYYVSISESDNEDAMKATMSGLRKKSTADTKKEEYKNNKAFKALEVPIEVNNTPKSIEEMDHDELQESMMEEANWIQRENLIECWEEGFGVPPSSSIMMRLNDDVETYGKEKTYCALREAVMYEKCSIDYIDAILMAWRDMTPEQIVDGERPSKTN